MNTRRSINKYACSLIPFFEGYKLEEEEVCAQQAGAIPGSAAFISLGVCYSQKGLSRA